MKGKTGNVCKREISHTKEQSFSCINEEFCCANMYIIVYLLNVLIKCTFVYCLMSGLNSD